MAQRATGWALGLALLLVPLADRALEPPHDVSNSISCDSCHGAHGGGMMGWGLLPGEAEQEAMCKSCHNPTGPAAALSDVANHVVDGKIVDCGTCHEPHSPETTTDPHPGGQTRRNMRLIRGKMKKYMADALEPTIFQDRLSHFAFNDDNSPWTGVCQTCHTKTDHHRNHNAADHSHKVGSSCTTCHPHEAGFLPRGGCTECHNEPQGSRRQIVENAGDGGGDFVRTSHHVQGTVDESNCTVCHFVGDHGSGTVKLRDPDQGDSLIYSFSPADPAGLEPFCLSCHDADGAGGNLFPFADGRMVPNVTGVPGSLWVDSAHKQIGYAQNGGNPLTCFGDGTNGCHGNAHGSDNEKLLNAAGSVTIDQLILGDLDTDTLATTGVSVWSWYEGGYVNAATGTIPARVVSAGPWPVVITGCPTGATSFQLNEPAGSATVQDEQGILDGTVNNPTAAMPGDGSFHGDEMQNTYIDFNDSALCLKEANTLTIEARIKPTAVDLDFEDTDGDGIDDNIDRNSTFSRIFERKRHIKITVIHADYRGDNVPERDEKASIEVKYFVDSASRHDCPHPQWPEDTYVGADALWHQISSDIDLYPLLNNHWYRIKVVFNSDKSGIPGSNGAPVDIFIDDEGEEGQSEVATEQWPGYVNASKTINESSSCKWGALPGDFMAMEDQISYIGTPPNHNAVSLFKGEIDYITWNPVADYSGVDDLPE